MAILVALMIAVPLLELWVIIEVGSLIGAVPAILLLLAFSVSGGLLVRREGRSAWRRLTETIGSGRIPARETADGALVVLAGALLLTPGFITDLAGLLLLAPPMRALIRRFGTAKLLNRSGFGMAFATATSVRSTAGRRRGRDYDVDSVAVDVDTSALDRPQGNPE